jgi:hypothetical protein
LKVQVKVADDIEKEETKERLGRRNGKEMKETNESIRTKTQCGTKNQKEGQLVKQSSL